MTALRLFYFVYAFLRSKPEKIRNWFVISNYSTNKLIVFGIWLHYTMDAEKHNLIDN